ncbi:MAG: hypothetical protein GEU97_15990 [Actinophytocola sp.]|nr:hypothetical protein [Actinophytocola sp.]
MAARISQRDVLAWVERDAASMLREDLVSELTGVVTAELAAEVPEVAADIGIRRDLDVSTHDLLWSYLVQAAKDPQADMTFPPAAVELARTLAVRGHDVSLLLRMYRVGQRVFWARLMRIVTDRIDDSELRMAVLEFLWDRVSRALERNIDLLVDTHTEESERRLRGALVRRTETVHAILRGEPIDVSAASEQLGHNLLRHQTALVLWARESAGEPDPSEQLEALAGDAAAALGCPRPLAVRSSARVVWAWLAGGEPGGRSDRRGRQSLRDGELPLERLRELDALRRSDSLRIAVGAPARGLDGFRTSHREALRAQRVAAVSVRDEPVTCYRDVELVSCLSADEEAMRAMVRRVLGGLGGHGGPGGHPGLAGHGEAAARLRATALAYLEAGGARAAAAALGVHKNTVLYRLRQVEDLLGHPLAADPLGLHLALILADRFGPHALP